MYVHSTDYELTTEFVQNPVFFLSPIHCKARIDIFTPMLQGQLISVKLWVEWKHWMKLQNACPPFVSTLLSRDWFTSHSTVKCVHHNKCQIGQKQLRQFKQLYNEMIPFLYLYEENSIGDYKPIFNPIIWFAIFCNILLYLSHKLPHWTVDC